ncbi:hypothetical protein H4Q26_013660 [Puccinia striiformis f. sp. tritici PST-130]|nr:hypothetical protein H4Q26_013660 [Puccinia striiformis f. sp. tritici PST-130]
MSNRFISTLEAHDANIMASLTVQDLVKFLCLAADVVVRSEKSLQLTTLRRPIRFLAASLPSSIHRFLDVFWEASFHILKDCYINTQHRINSMGIMAELGDGRIPTRIVHQSLFPPVKHCPKCSKERPMRPSWLFGYLYDVDGCHTIQHFSLYCQRKDFDSDMRWTMTDRFLYSICVSVPDKLSYEPNATKVLSVQHVLMVPSTGLDRVLHILINILVGLILVVRAVVTDGLTIGHWRCSASAAQLENLAKESGQPAPDGPCRRTLDTVRNQYCSFHQPFLEGICQAQPCIQPALPNQRTCGLQSHRDAAQTFGTRVNSNFQLHSMLNRPGSNCTSGRQVRGN